MAARAPTDPEWAELVGDLERLLRPTTFITGPKTPEPGPPFYNCIAWAVGYDNRWINPAPLPDDFTAQMATYGLMPCTEAQAVVDAFRKNGRMVHASRYNNNHASWESKLGEDERILHVRNQVEGVLYGAIAAHFRLQVAKEDKKAQEIVVPASDGPASASTDTISRISDLSSALGAAFGDLASDFEKRFTAWKDTWFTGSMSKVQSSSDRAHGPEWDALVKLGPNVLPFVVTKLAKNCFAAELYNKLETDESKKVSPKDIKTFYDLSLQTAKDVQLFGTKVETFDRYADSWTKYTKSISKSSVASDRFNDDSFKSMVNMGLGAAPLVMNRYVKEGGSGWWHEVLHQIVYGKPSSAETIKPDELFREWKVWFEATTRDTAAAAAA